MTRPKRTFKKQKCGACNGEGKRPENVARWYEVPKMEVLMCLACMGTGRVRRD